LIAFASLLAVARAAETLPATKNEQAALARYEALVRCATRNRDLEAYMALFIKELLPVMQKNEGTLRTYLVKEAVPVRRVTGSKRVEPELANREIGNKAWSDLNAILGEESKDVQFWEVTQEIGNGGSSHEILLYRQGQFYKLHN